MHLNPPNPQIPESFWDSGHPYRLRTWLRAHLPGPISDLFPKAADCEARGRWHRWYNQDGVHSECYHCKVVAGSQFWHQAPRQPEMQA